MYSGSIGPTLALNSIEIIVSHTLSTKKVDNVLIEARSFY